MRPRIPNDKCFRRIGKAGVRTVRRTLSVSRVALVTAAIAMLLGISARSAATQPSLVHQPSYTVKDLGTLGGKELGSMAL